MVGPWRFEVDGCDADDDACWTFYGTYGNVDCDCDLIAVFVSPRDRRARVQSRQRNH